MGDGVLAINTKIGLDASKQAIGLEAKVKASMRAVIAGNFMETNDNELFKAGVGGALLDVGVDSADGIRIIESNRALQKLGAYLSALQTGLNCEPPEIETEALPLMAWWHEAKDSTHA